MSNTIRLFVSFRRTTVVAVVFALLLSPLALTACQQRTDVLLSPEEAGRSTLADSSSTAGSGLYAAPEGEEGEEGPGSDDMGSEELLGDVRNRAAVEADRARFLVREYMRQARALIDNSEYAKAERVLMEAQALQPGNIEVDTQLQIVRDLQGKRAATAGQYADEQRKLVNVLIQQQRAQAAKMNALGKVHLAAGRWDDAIESYEDAQMIITASPYEIDWGGLESEVENGLREATYMKNQAADRQRQDQILKGLAERASQEEQRLMQEMLRLETYMGRGVEAFERGDYELAMRMADQVLAEQPDNTKARDLRLAASRANHAALDKQYLRDEKLRFRQWMDDMNRTRIPQDKVIIWPQPDLLGAHHAASSPVAPQPQPGHPGGCRG